VSPRVRNCYYDQKKKVLVVCLAGARLLLRPEKNKVLVVCQAGARSLLQLEKKVLVFCLAGARLLLRPENKVLVVCLASARSLLRPEKKSSSHLTGGLCCCVSFWFWWDIGFGCTYYYVLGVPYSCGVVLFFWF
jgi:hypothetical protein